ncbi:MAG TPA: hypothetical protein VLJ62_06595, partial [Burkholderiaceae bacterium]|nr:hypothetical protein [Burkholderiaceae bacterium]
WLASWPTGPGGTAQPVWVLPAGRQWATKDKRAAWRKVSPDDRRLLRSLLESLPQIYAEASGPDGTPIALTAAESRALARLAADARRTMSPPLLREWARRWAAAWRGR